MTHFLETKETKYPQFKTKDNKYKKKLYLPVFLTPFPHTQMGHLLKKCVAKVIFSSSIHIGFHQPPLASSQLGGLFNSSFNISQPQYSLVKYFWGLYLKKETIFSNL